MLATLAWIVLFLVGAFLLWAIGSSIYIYICYLPKLARIFEEQPFFVTEESPPLNAVEEVSFRTSDGLTLRGGYWKTSARQRLGVILFCHEYLADRRSAANYCAGLWQAGFDVFTFDFRNHGQSDALAGYEPLQWVTDYEVRDVEAALGYLEQRNDLNGEKIGLFGISRGGAAGICAAAQRTSVFAVATDGAFPTSGTQIYYIYRWSCIYSPLHWIFAHVPRWYVRAMAWLTCRQVGRKRHCRFANIERALARLNGRPVLMIHGQRDNYIVPEIVEELLRYTRSKAEFWLVPKAKHNQCLEVAPEEYHKRLQDFFASEPVGRSADRQRQAALIQS